MITTNNKNYFDHIQTLRNHGASVSEEERHLGPKPYILPDFKVLGFNYRMTDLQGAFGSVQLKKLNSFISERSKYAQYYKKQFKEIDWIKCPDEPSIGRHAWQAYVLLIDKTKISMDTNDIMEYLKKEGISTRPGTHAIHKLDYYKNKYGLTNEEFPNSTYCSENSIAIPLHNKIKQSEID